MRLYAVLLQKKSLDGDTSHARWVMQGVKPFTGPVNVAQDIKPSAIVGPSTHGGPRAFLATLLVIWEAEAWDDVSRKAVELWANGAFMVRGGDE